MARKDNNGKGALIDKWTWKYKGVEDELSAHLRGEEEEPDGPKGMSKSDDRRKMLIADKHVELEVRMLKTYTDEQLPRTVKAVEFSVTCAELGIELIGTDIEVLRQAAWAKLEKQFKIKWETYYLIQIAHAQAFVGDFEVGFSLSQNTIYRGVTHDGSVLMREYERGRTFGPWRYAPWPGEYQDKGGHVIACIPATDKNDRALNEFRARIRELQERLSDLVRPEEILATLENLAATGLPLTNRQRIESGGND
jgi:hypothetical protein